MNGLVDEWMSGNRDLEEAPRRWVNECKAERGAGVPTRSNVDIPTTYGIRGRYTLKIRVSLDCPTCLSTILLLRGPSGRAPTPAPRWAVGERMSSGECL